jgi:hypothetical protein
MAERNSGTYLGAVYPTPSAATYSSTCRRCLSAGGYCHHDRSHDAEMTPMNGGKAGMIGRPLHGRFCDPAELE